MQWIWIYCKNYRYTEKSLFYSANYVFQQPDPLTFTYPSYADYRADEYSFFVYAPNAEGNTGVVREALLELTLADYCSDNVASYLFYQRFGNGGHWLLDKRF